MKKLFFTLSFFLCLTTALVSENQIRSWMFDTPEWKAKKMFNAPDVVDELGILAGTETPVTIENANKMFVHPEGNYLFTNALRLSGSGLPDVSMPFQPTTRAVAFGINGPGTIEIISLSTTQDTSQLLITDGNQLLHTIQVKGNNFSDPFGGQLPLDNFRYTGGPTILYIFAADKGVDLFYIQIPAGDSIHREPVTFNVNVPAGTNQCWIAGSFNRWNTSSHQMQKLNDNNYTLTVTDVDVSTLEYKYMSGPGSTYFETDPTGEEVPNRTYQSNDTVQNWLNVFEPDNRSVTYTVNVPSGTNQVCIAGDFNNWIPSMHWMQQIGPETFRITIQNADTGMKYKYFNGPNWTFQETSRTGAPVPDRSWSELDTVEAWGLITVPDEIQIFYEDIHTFEGEEITMDIKMSSNEARQSIAFQFELHFDANTIEYISYTTQGTVAAMGDVVINSTRDVGVLYISFMSSESFDIVNSLIKLNFNVINLNSVNTTSPSFNECYIDDQQISQSLPGTIYINQFMLGDVDGNQRVQAYDAALTLQYSVGKDPIPLIAPRPWEGWRLEAADVDGVPGITANDAAMILQYSAYIIDSFDNVRSNSSAMKAPNQKMADVEIIKDQQNLYFKSYGDLVGFNLFIEEELDAFGTPVISGNVISAVNVGSSIYAVGVAAIEPMEDGTIFLTIPLLRNIDSGTLYKMYVNSDEISRVLEAHTSVKSLSESGISLFPNPASNMVELNNLKEGSLIRIYDISGREVLQKGANSSFERIDISKLTRGIYSISILNNNANTVSKFIKQ